MARNARAHGARNARNEWTVTSGRTLCFRGRPVVSLDIARDAGSGSPAVFPAVADRLTHRIAAELNAGGARPGRKLPRKIEE